MDTAKPIRFRFGPFELDATTEEIFENGEPVPLQSKPFQFLVMLLQHQGSLVTREQMSHVLWPDIYVQVNQGLNAAARKVRIAIRDEFSTPKYFETLGSDGYRFVHPAEVLAWSHYEETKEAQIFRIAVLPFRVEENEEEALGNGFAGELISILGSLHPRLKIVAPTSVQGYCGTDVSGRLILEQLGARYVLKGSIVQQRERFSIRVRLLELPEESVLWESKAEHANLAEILNDVPVGVLRATLPGLSAKHPSPGPWAKMRAKRVREYFSAQQLWFRRTGSNLGLALAAYQRVCEREPEFAQAHTGRANVWIMLAAHNLVAPRPAYQAAVAAAERALDRNPDLPEALVAQAWAKLALDHDWANSTRLFERALQMNSSYAFGYAGYGHLLLSRGRVDEAVSAMERGYSLDPLSTFMAANYAMACYYARRFDETIRVSRRTLEIDSGNCAARVLLGSAYLAQRRFVEAMQQFETGVQWANGEAAVMEAYLAHAYAQAGKTANVEPILRRLETEPGRAPQPAYQIALVRLGLGDVNGAVHWLERACQERCQTTLFLGVDPHLDILRGTKHFDEMCKRVREPDFRQASFGRRRSGAA